MTRLSQPDPMRCSSNALGCSSSMCSAAPGSVHARREHLLIQGWSLVEVLAVVTRGRHPDQRDGSEDSGDSRWPVFLAKIIRTLGQIVLAMPCQKEKLLIF